MKVPFFKPDISDVEIAEVVDTLKSGWLTTGPKTKKFEADFASFVGAKYAVALNSCTAALHLALEAIGLKRGDLVILPTMTFAATAEIVRYFDAIPVFVDCDDKMCIDQGKLQTTIESIKLERSVAGLKPPYGPLKAIIPVHYGGYICDMDNIMTLATKFSLNVIEDCAHTVPSYYSAGNSDNYIHAGQFGKVGCFSFYANKCITTGEGGMAVTNDKKIADRMRVMSLHGMNNDAWARFSDQGSWYYEIVAPGFKYNMTDIAAAIGLHQLKRAEEFQISRQNIAERYNVAFAQIPALQVPPDDSNTKVHSWHLYWLRLNLHKLSIQRAEFIKKLNERGISCSVHWMPLHLHPYYRETFGLSEGVFPISEREWPRLISLPIFPSMTDDEIDYVIEVVEDVVKQNSI